MNSLSLRQKLIAICVSTMILGMIAVVIANFYTTKSRMLESMNAQMSQLSQKSAASIADWAKSQKTVVSSLKLAVESPDPLPAVKAAQMAGGFDLSYIGYADKHFVFSEERKRAADYDPTARPWYKKASQIAGPVLTAPYTSASTGKLLVTFAEAVGISGQASAVVASDVLLDSVINSVNAIKPTPDSFSFLVDKIKGNIIAHPNKDLILKPLKDIDEGLSVDSLEDIAKSGGGKEMRLNGRAGLLYMTPIDGTDWMLVIVLDKAQATHVLDALLVSSAITAIVLSIAAFVILTFLITQSLKRMETVRDAMIDIASGDGDLTRRLNEDGQDELAQISSAFNRFVDKISSVLFEIRHASESVKGASGEIAAGNADLSSRTEMQAGSLEETSSTMEELTSTVKHNADNARQANQMALAASSVALSGGEVVARVVETMGSIKDSSRKIVDIIGVIDGIAFQTNILALNAAVEAARAGEQGRGFVVVASEVRNLAQRSATAAKEIKSLIDASVHEVDAGSQLVEQAGNTMTEVVSSVRRVTDIVGEISAASQEQSSGIAEIGRAITQMDEATQQNAALVEQAAAAAQSLQDQAAHLAEVVAEFKLEDRAVAPVGRATKRTVDITPSSPAIKAKPAVKKEVAKIAAAKPAGESKAMKAGSDENGSWEEF